MHSAKQQGKNRYGFYDEELDAISKRQLNLESALRRALSNDELELHYQPQVNLATGSLCGVEALLRWRHPDHGPISPANIRCAWNRRRSQPCSTTAVKGRIRHSGNRLNPKVRRLSGVLSVTY